MKRTRSFFAPEDPNHGRDSDMIWARLDQPTGARRLNAWALLSTVAILSIILMLLLVVWHVVFRT